MTATAFDIFNVFLYTKNISSAQTTTTHNRSNTKYINTMDIHDFYYLQKTHEQPGLWASFYCFCL